MSSNVIQKIFRDHGTRYIESCGGSVQPEHYKVIKAICECRTGLRGKHLFECPECEYKELVNSSCGNRHCPVCQHKKAIQWVYEREIRTLPCNYFLATFTIPKDLRDIAYANQKIIYSALFKCAAESLKVLEADKRFVGCKTPGFFGVLHTWTRQLLYHPHIHFVIPGGGLSQNGDKWISAKGSFLVHVKALSSIFRAKMKDELTKAGIADNVSLPSGFTKIRYYGFLSPNCKVPLQRIKELICTLYEILRNMHPPKQPKKSRPKICPKCKNVMRWKKFIFLSSEIIYIDYTPSPP